MSIVAGADLEAMIDIARKASATVGELYEEHLRASIRVDMKRPGDPVTEADRAANGIICAALGEAFPGAAVVAEESVPSAAALEEMGRRFRVFYVDPLDGTREFVDGVPEFAVMIGLAEGGRAVAGVVATPHDRCIAAGGVHERAFIERADGTRALLRVTPEAIFSQARLVVSRSHEPALIDPLCRRLGIRQRARCGSVGVKVLRLVQGEADLYVHTGPGLKSWDVCAPEAILAAAGGRATDVDGAQHAYDPRKLAVKRGLVATNGVLHAGVLSAVGWAEREVARLRGSR